LLLAVDKQMLFAPPFTNIHNQGLLGVFDEANKVIKLIDRVSGNALADVMAGRG